MTLQSEFDLPVSFQTQHTQITVRAETVTHTVSRSAIYFYPSRMFWRSDQDPISPARFPSGFYNCLIRAPTGFSSQCTFNSDWLERGRSGVIIIGNKKSTGAGDGCHSRTVAETGDTSRGIVLHGGAEAGRGSAGQATINVDKCYACLSLCTGYVSSFWFHCHTFFLCGDWNIKMMEFRLAIITFVTINTKTHYENVTLVGLPTPKRWNKTTCTIFNDSCNYSGMY